ncbi:MAG TPA: acetylornithine transaminase [Mycobacteriales bacterium]|nr:acetylornithine transaminase [Mycobacteriales bacterium]
MSAGNAAFQQRWEAVMMRNYGVPPIALVKGSGTRVTDADGREYLDLIAGIAVSSLGHAHPAVVAAVAEQVATLAHSSNLFINPPALALAERLTELMGVPGTRAFLSNDGATANETAIKTALRARPGRRRFVAAESSFHGRTLGALALTGKAAIREPFGPFGFDVDFVPYGDPAALEAAVDGRTAAVFLEPTLGEAGVIPPPDGYLRQARRVCDAAGALLVIDEVQGGIGRTGKWFAHQHEGVVPDIVTVAKGLGGGLPVGACLANGDAAEALQRGDHGSTFGGNPVSCAAALAVIDVIDREGLLDHVERLGAQWKSDLQACADGLLTGVRGRGLWLGLETRGGGPAIEAAARDQGFLINATGPDAVRLAPPLILTAADASAFTAAVPGILEAAGRALEGAA